MNTRLVLNLLWVIVVLVSCEEKNNSTLLLTDQDKAEIQSLARDIPLVLANEGWEPYEESFTDDYRNWSMVRDKVRFREEYLGLVKDWYDAGNRATASDVKSIEFIPISENMTLYLHSQREEFINPEDSAETLIRDIRFVTIYRKENDRWKLQFTAFMDAP